MEVPENWYVKENNFDIELLRNNSHSISFSNKMTNRVRKNWLWNARNSQDKKELVELHTTIRNAREDERPMSQKLKTKIDGNDYVFLSLVENYVIKRLYMMAQQVDDFPETQYLLLATSKLSNFSEGHHISNANSDLKTLHCLAKNAEKVMPKSCQKVMHEQLLEASSYEGGIEMYIDIILVIVVALIVVWLFVYRTLKKFCEQRSL